MRTLGCLCFIVPSLMAAPHHGIYLGAALGGIASTNIHGVQGVKKGPLSERFISQSTIGVNHSFSQKLDLALEAVVHAPIKTTIEDGSIAQRLIQRIISYHLVPAWRYGKWDVLVQLGAVRHGIKTTISQQTVSYTQIRPKLGLGMRYWVGAHNFIGVTIDKIYGNDIKNLATMVAKRQTPIQTSLQFAWGYLF